MISRNMLASGNYDRVQFAIITAVNPEQGTVSIIFCDQFGFRDDVPIPVISMSADAWIRFMPQVNDVVHVGIRSDESAVILGWHPFKYENRITAYENDDDSAVGGKGPEFLTKLQPGEIDMRSRGGAYLKLDRIGDVLLMSLAGRIQMFGREGFMEVSQTATKITDGLNTFRFGTPYRLYANSDREIPSLGSGYPQADPVHLRESDHRLFDENGNIVVQDSAATAIMDSNGILELSGTSGGGNALSIQSRLQKVSTGLVGAKKLFSRASFSEVRRYLSQQISNILDHVREFVVLKTATIIGAISTVIVGAGKNPSLGNLGTYTTDITEILEGGGIHQDGTNGVGARGKALRRRILIAEHGLQKAAFDIDEDGGVVLSSQSSDGININANTGSLTFYALKGIKLFAQVLVKTAQHMVFSAVTTFKLTCGATMQFVANIIHLNAATTTRTADVAIIDSSQGAITLQVVDSNGIATGTSVSITPGTITITGTTNIAITAPIVTIN